MLLYGIAFLLFVGFWEVGLSSGFFKRFVYRAFGGGDFLDIGAIFYLLGSFVYIFFGCVYDGLFTAIYERAVRGRAVLIYGDRGLLIGLVTYRYYLASFLFFFLSR